MALILLSGIQILLLVGVAALFWRRLDQMNAEITRLRDALGARDTMSVATARRRAVGESFRLAPVDADTPSLFQELEPAPTELAPEAELQLEARASLKAPTLSPETARGLALAVAATAPAAAFFFGGSAAAAVSAGLCIAAAMMLVALRPLWRAAAWAAVITSGAWALIGFALGAAQAAPAIFSIAVTFAGAAGLAHAQMRRATPGSTMALFMAVAALALGTQIGLVSAPGAAYGALVALAALLGASTLRLESIYLAAFGAALLGLFVLSGQETAAIWFTPVTSLAGALFLAIAAVRVPQLGARGLALAGGGAVASLATVAALHASGHGLADPIAAAIAFVVVAGALSAIIAASAQRRERGLAALKLTLWALGCAAFAGWASALFMALPSPWAATAFAATSAALAMLDRRAPDYLWRTLIWIAAACALVAVAACMRLLLTEAPEADPWTLIALGIAAPSVLLGAGAWVAHRSEAPATAALLEALTIALGLIAANLALRMLASNGALVLTPLGFPEAGLHIALWLAAGLLIASRASLGAQIVRNSATLGLGVAALGASVVITVLWLTPHWTVRMPNPAASPLLQFDGLGFLAPAILFWAHWVFWRARGANMRTRIALGAGAFLTASLVTLETLQSRPSGADALAAAVSALAFALAIGINFAPGVTQASAPRPSYFQEDLQRQRRRQVRRQAR